MISFNLIRQIILSQEVINSIIQFVRIITAILKDLFHICKSFLNDIKVKNSKSRYEDKKVVSEIRRFVLKHIINLDQILLNFKLIECIISRKKFQFCIFEIKIVNFICDFND